MIPKIKNSPRPETGLLSGVSEYAVNSIFCGSMAFSCKKSRLVSV